MTENELDIYQAHIKDGSTDASLIDAGILVKTEDKK